VAAAHEGRDVGALGQHHPLDLRAEAVGQLVGALLAGGVTVEEQPDPLRLLEVAVPGVLPRVRPGHAHSGEPELLQDEGIELALGDAQLLGVPGGVAVEQAAVVAAARLVLRPLAVVGPRSAPDHDDVAGHEVGDRDHAAQRVDELPALATLDDEARPHDVLRLVAQPLEVLPQPAVGVAQLVLDDGVELEAALGPGEPRVGLGVVAQAAVVVGRRFGEDLAPLVGAVVVRQDLVVVAEVALDRDERALRVADLAVIEPGDGGARVDVHVQPAAITGVLAMEHAGQVDLVRRGPLEVKALAEEIVLDRTAHSSAVNQRSKT
jgi:hypothetical protein